MKSRKFASTPPSIIDNCRMKNAGIWYVIVFLLCSISSAKSDKWHEWLGQNKTGNVKDFIPPPKWPPKLTRKWKLHLGTGYGTPILEGNKIFSHSRKNNAEYVVCINKQSGKILWSEMQETPFTIGGGGEKHGKGPKANPVYSDGIFYTLGISGVLSAWDAEDGKRRWSKVPGKSFGQAHAHWGASNSPTVLGNKIINLFGNDEKGALMALDKYTGKTIWSLPCNGTCYSSPIHGKIGGVQKVVVLNHESLIGVNVKSGELLWEFPFPHRTHNQNMTTPVIYENKVIFGGENRGVYCIEPKLKNGNWEVNKVWSQKKVALNMASPLIANNLLFGLSHYGSGRFFCINPTDGKIFWQGDPRTAQNAMFLSFKNHVLALTNHGKLNIFLSSGKEFKNVASYKVSDDQTWAPPVLLNDGLLIKDSQNLTYWNL